MPLSPALYQSSQIPFVHVEGIRLIENVNRELAVEVQISNEVKEILTDDPLSFGNFIYLSSDQNTILDLAENPSALKALILNSQSDHSRLHNYQLSLTRDDFSFKGHLAVAGATPNTPQNGENIYGHTTQKSFVLNKVKGGNIMTGLIADAHIERIWADIAYGWAAIGRLQQGERATIRGDGSVEFQREIDIASQSTAAISKRVTDLYLLAASYRLHKRKCFLGNVTKEVVIRHSVSPPTTKLWSISQNIGAYGPVGSTWPGDIHQVAGQNNQPQAMVGTLHTTAPHPNVTSLSLPNIKIKDMRFLATARNLKFDYASPTEVERPYFSPITLSRDDSGQIHGAFAFDLQSYAKQNAKFGLLIKNTPALLSCVGIPDIRIMRRVIKRDAAGNKLTPGADTNNEIPGQNGWKPISAELGAGNLKMMDLPRVDEQGSTNIIFVDKGAGEHKTGTVEYKAEVMVDDKTHDVITLLRDQLQNLITQNTNSAAPGQAPQNFGHLILGYLKTINFIFGTTPFNIYSLEAWKKNLEALTSEHNSSEYDRVLVVSLIQNFIDQISKQLATPQSISAGSFQVYSHITSPKPPGVLVAEHEFRNRYKISNGRGVGMDYSYGFLANRFGTIPTFSYGEYQQRVNNELAKYELANTSAEGINPYGYFSPNSFFFGPDGAMIKRIPTVDFKLDPTNFTPLFRNNALQTYQYSEGSQKSVATNMAEIFSAGGANVIHLKESLREVLFPEDDPVAPPVPPQLYMAMMSPFNFDNSSGPNLLSGSTQSIQIGIQQLPGDAVYGAPASQWLLNSQIASFHPPSLIRNPGSIAGSVALVKYLQDETSISDSNALSNIVNFESLTRVEYLEAYDATLGASAPVWKILDANAFQTAQANSDALLCRLVSINGVVDADVDLGLQPLNTLFVLGSAKVVSRVTNYVSALTQIVSYIQTASPGANGSILSSQIPYSKNIPTRPPTGGP
tara:strand:- start:7392 stop:10283 length:2892 start_codon:yes stop_codon:yes gene_type:complete